MSVLTPEELEAMRDCTWVLREIGRDLRAAIVAGRATREIDQIAGELVETYGVRAAFKGYRGYPATITTSVNEEVIDGLPGKRELADGDVLKLQLGIESEGYYAYAATTHLIGNTPPEAVSLLACARRALVAAVDRCAVGTPVAEISAAIQRVIEGDGFHVVRQYCGHGIGRRMHEDPQIPCFVDPAPAPTYRLADREVVALQVLALDRPERLVHRGGLTVVAPAGVHSVHVGAIVAAGRPPEILLGTERPPGAVETGA